MSKLLLTIRLFIERSIFKRCVTVSQIEWNYVYFVTKCETDEIFIKNFVAAAKLIPELRPLLICVIQYYAKRRNICSNIVIIISEEKFLNALTESKLYFTPFERFIHSHDFLKFIIYRKSTLQNIHEYMHLVNGLGIIEYLNGDILKILYEICRQINSEIILNRWRAGGNPERLQNFIISILDRIGLYFVLAGYYRHDKIIEAFNTESSKRLLCDLIIDIICVRNSYEYGPFIMNKAIITHDANSARVLNTLFNMKGLKI